MKLDQNQSDPTMLYYKDDELRVSYRESYFCENVHELRLTDKDRDYTMGYLKMSNIYYEAFKESGRDFSSRLDCNANFKNSGS